jgi:hypothetical protein
MNKIRISFFAGVALALASGGLDAQTAIQNITLSLIGEYQTNTFVLNGTNAETPEAPWTSEFSQIRPILISTFNVKRALAYDLEGPGSTTWDSAQLVREVNLTNGNEGIFLRVGDNQTNVSRFFGGSFSNNFQAGLTNAFPALTNNISGLTNDVLAYTNNSTNISLPQTLIDRGWLYRPNLATTTNATNDYLTTAGIYFISLNTTNTKFNLVAVGDGTLTKVAGSGGSGTRYESVINSEFLGCAGTYYLNIATNIFDTGSVPPVYVTGPMHGTFITGPPYFSPIPGP